MAGKTFHPFTKRCFDLAVAIPALAISGPVMVICALLVRIVMGKNIFFRQMRPGIHGKPFSIIKFRTMVQRTDSNGNPLPDSERLTRFGRFLRSTSLDELPELYNVVRGDMSIVGPRPLLMQYLERYSPEQMRRHEVKPGITGWAQVNGRNALSWEDRFRLDVWYVDNATIRLDLKIIVMTLYKALIREAINHPGHATMEEFRGTDMSGLNHSKG